MEPRNSLPETESSTAPLSSAVIYRQSDISNLYRMSASAVERAMRVEGFPHPIRIGVRSKGWWRAEVDAWFANRPRSLQPCSGLTQYTTDSYLNRFS